MKSESLGRISFHPWWGQTYTGSSSGSKDETAEVGGALVGQSTGSVDESGDAVRLETSADKRGAPGGGGTGSLLGLDELLLGVGRLGALVGLAKQRREDGELNAVVESKAEGNSRGLDGGEVCRRAMLATGGLWICEMRMKMSR